MSDISEFTCTGCKLSTWSMYDLSGKSHIVCPQGGGRWQPTIKDGGISGYTVTVHLSPDCSRDTLEALGEMMKHLIEHIEKVHIPIGQPNTRLHTDGRERGAFCEHGYNGHCLVCDALNTPPAGKA